MIQRYFIQIVMISVLISQKKIYRLIDTHTRKTLGVIRNRSLIDLDRLPVGETISETSELLKNRNKAVIIVIVGG